MTVDARVQKRMPAAVLTAAVLLGLAGVIAGVGTATYGALRLDDGGGPLMLVGGGVLVAAGACVYGLVNRFRGAQIAVGVIAVFGLLASITALTMGNPLNLAWGAAAVLIGTLALIPASSREWFSR